MASPVTTSEPEKPLTKVVEQAAQIRWLELRVKDLETQL